MALLTCPKCGNFVSDKATACMRCGMLVSDILAQQQQVQKTQPTQEPQNIRNSKTEQISPTKEESSKTSVKTESKNISNEPSTKKQEKTGNNNSKWVAIIILIVIIALGICGIVFLYSSQQQDELQAKYEQQLTEEKDKVNQLTEEKDKAKLEQAKAEEAQRAAEKEKRELEENIRKAQEEATSSESTNSEVNGYSSSYSTHPSKVRVTGERVRLRRTPRIESDNIVKYTNGETVYPDKGDILECVGETDEWYKIKFQERTFYISKQFTEPY